MISMPPSARIHLGDSSAAAIAAGGMLQLAKTSGDYCTRYRQSAHRILALLSQNFLDHDNQTQGIVKHACYSKPHNEGVDSCFIVGDYFFPQSSTPIGPSLNTVSAFKR